MRDGRDEYKAVASGHWPLIRYDPMVRAASTPLLLGSPGPRMRLGDCGKGELRLRALANTDPAEAERLQDLERTVGQRWQIDEEMATRGAGDSPANAREDH